MAALGEKWIFCTSNEEEIIYITDRRGKVIKKDIKDKVKGRRQLSRPFDPIDNGVHYIHWEHDHLYKIDTFGNIEIFLTVPDNDHPNKSIINTTAMAGEHIYLGTQVNQKMTKYVVDIIDDKYYDVTNLKNDITYSKSFLMPVLGKRGDYLITYLPAEYLLDQLKKKENKIYNNHFQDAMERIDAHSNHLLVLQKIGI